MIEWFMFGALGFFLGCLLALMLAPPLWNRAVKLTTRKLEATMPMSLADIQADKDQLRAEFAIELRKVEVALEKSKEKAARELIEANKRRVEIQVLDTDLGAVKGQLQESLNANRVLQQTIKRRLPDLDARLKAAKKALSELETVNAELRNTVASQSEALKIARGTVHNQRADIDRLRMTLESGSAAAMRGSSKSDGRALVESQRLAAELSRVQEELDRVMPVIDALVAAGIAAAISIDTYKPIVADQAIQAGAAIINDVHGLQGAPEMADVAALHYAPVVAMHWDKSRDTSVPLIDVMQRYFDATIARAELAGINRANLILDPGFGFGKSLPENYLLLNNLKAACSGNSELGEFPILVGTSRKSMIGKLLDAPADQRLAGTVATTVLGYMGGGHIFRVHDVRANKDALRVAQATLYGPPAELE